VETMGTYVIDEQGACHFVVFDADSLDGLVQLLGVQRRLAADGVASALEGSRRGGHLWVWFAAPLAPALVRRWLLPYCPAGVEFYPKRDWATWEEPGSLVRVPLGVHRLSGRRYPFLVPAGAGDRLVPAAQRVSDSLEWLATIERVRVPQQVEAGLLDVVRVPDTHPYVATGMGGTSSLDGDTSVNIHDWCDRQDAVRVTGRFVELDQRGMGCCPFGWHHSDGKDTHPSLWVHQPRASGGPCWYCYVWQRSGNLFDFLCLWYDVSSREMWQRILAGETW
jgi:TOTE conflict system, Archaeo-Eukaryotic Primase domain